MVDVSVPRYFSTVPDVTLLQVINTNSFNVLICIFELHIFFCAIWFPRGIRDGGGGGGVFPAQGVGCCWYLHIKNRSDLYPVSTLLFLTLKGKETNFRGHKLTPPPKKTMWGRTHFFLPSFLTYRSFFLPFL